MPRGRRPAAASSIVEASVMGATVIAAGHGRAGRALRNGAAIDRRENGRTWERGRVGVVAVDAVVALARAAREVPVAGHAAVRAVLVVASTAGRGTARTARSRRGDSTAVPSARRSACRSWRRCGRTGSSASPCCVREALVELVEVGLAVAQRGSGRAWRGRSRTPRGRGPPPRPLSALVEHRRAASRGRWIATARRVSTAPARCGRGRGRGAGSRAPGGAAPRDDDERPRRQSRCRRQALGTRAPRGAPPSRRRRRRPNFKSGRLFFAADYSARDSWPARCPRPRSLPAPCAVIAPRAATARPSDGPQLAAP